MRVYTVVFILIALLAFSFPTAAREGMKKMMTGETEEPADIKDLSQAERAGTIIGEQVKNKKMETLGYIEDMIVGPDGITYLILSPQGISQQKDNFIPIPWGLVIGRTKTALVVNVSREQLAMAPGFKANMWPDFSNPQLESKISAYYRSK